MEISTGIMMGDSTLANRSGTPYLQVGGFTEPEYLRYLHDVFGSLSTGVRDDMSAEEKARHNRNHGFSPNADPENYKDSYVWRTRVHPGFEKFIEWYSSGDKIFPESIRLSPVILKHWFCCDGNYNSSGRNNNIRIGISNEASNTNKIDSYFREEELPVPNNYDFRSTEYGLDCRAEFSKNSSQQLWGYMGCPPPGFEYKWP